MFVKKLFQFIAKNFVFVGGILFVFVIGLVYSLLRPESIWVNVIFLAIVLGWVVFIIVYFWDLMDKNKILNKKDEESSKKNLQSSTSSDRRDFSEN